MSRDRGDWRSALPRRRSTRVLLALGAAALIAVIPLMWMWLLYASGLPETTVLAGAFALAGLAAGTGAAMIRILDGSR